jgi:hypothetical protein
MDDKPNPQSPEERKRVQRVRKSNIGWWRTETTQVWTGYGTLIIAESTGEPIPCPKCVIRPVVYNGNYFCDGYDTRDCDWALAHPTRKEDDKRIAALIGLRLDKNGYSY